MSLQTVMQEQYPEQRIISQVGEIVVATAPGYGLRSGGCGYEFAIIISVDPLVGVSEDADMRWGSTIDTEHFHAVGKANQEAIDKCMRRL